MSHPHTDDERPAALTELRAAIERRVTTLLDSPGAQRPFVPSEFSIQLQDTHQPWPLEDVAQWVILSGFKYDEYPTIEHLVPTWLALVLRHAPYPAITLWVREDRQLAITYVKTEDHHIIVGFEILDEITLKLDGIRALTRLLQAQSNTEES